MRLLLVCPEPPGTRRGNRVSALRWARLLRAAGHRVRVAGQYAGQPCDALIALHAWRSAGSVARFRTERPGAPVVVVLTGTDLYRDLAARAGARAAIRAAERLVVLHPLGAERLPPGQRAKCRVVVQGAEPIVSRLPRRPREFTVLVAAHLRPEKDPLRTALAVRTLPAGSRIRVRHAGEALVPGFAERARAEMARNARYVWLGDVPRWRVRQLMSRSRLLVLSSRMEGGANVIGEAVQAGLPMLLSRIHSSEGLLGRDYPGFFPVGDTRALRALLLRAESDPGFLATLSAAVGRRADRFSLAREQADWARLIDELASLVRH